METQINHLNITISQLRSQLHSAHGECSSLDISLRKSEGLLLDKERIINELKTQVVTMERRIEAERRTREDTSTKSIEITTEAIDQLQVSIIIIVEEE